MQRPVSRNALRQLTIAIFGICLFGSLHLSAQQPSPDLHSLFDGVSLSGWKAADPSHADRWYVKDSAITAGDGIYPIPVNTYLRTEAEFEDFEFRCLFKLSGDATTGLINSGIQYRSNMVDGTMVGYQADIGNGYWGDIYDEHRRGKLVGGDLSVLRHILREDDWNSYIIRVKGNHHELYINGVKTCDYVEKDSSIPTKGVIAVQIHSGGAAKVEFRDLTITQL